MLASVERSGYPPDVSGQMTTCGVSYPRSHAKFLLRLISHYEGIGGEPWKNRHSRSVFWTSCMIRLTPKLGYSMFWRTLPYRSICIFTTPWPITPDGRCRKRSVQSSIRWTFMRWRRWMGSSSPVRRLKPWNLIKCIISPKFEPCWKR